MKISTLVVVSSFFVACNGLKADPVYESKKMIGPAKVESQVIVDQKRKNTENKNLVQISQTVSATLVRDAYPTLKILQTILGAPPEPGDGGSDAYISCIMDENNNIHLYYESIDENPDFPGSGTNGEVLSMTIMDPGIASESETIISTAAAKVVVHSGEQFYSESMPSCLHALVIEETNLKLASKCQSADRLKTFSVEADCVLRIE